MLYSFMQQNNKYFLLFAETRIQIATIQQLSTNSLFLLSTICKVTMHSKLFLARMEGTTGLKKNGDILDKTCFF